MSNVQSTFTVIAALLFAAVMHAQGQVNIDFDQESDFTENFYVAYTNVAATGLAGWNATDECLALEAGAANNALATFMYDTTPGDGVTTIDKFLLEDGLRFDLRVTEAQSWFGMWLRVTDNGTKGIFVALATRTTQVGLRTGLNPLAGQAGFTLLSDVFTAPAAGNWLRWTIWVKNNESDLLDISYELRDRDSGDLIHEYTFTDVAITGSSGLEPGQIAFGAQKRYAANTVQWDNFTILKSVPPSGTVVLIR